MGKNKKKKGYRAEELAKKTIRVESISQGRFAIIDADTGEILDDANGYGYKSKQNAMRAWNYKTQPKDENVEKLYVYIEGPTPNLCQVVYNFFGQDERGWRYTLCFGGGEREVLT